VLFLGFKSLSEVILINDLGQGASFSIFSKSPIFKAHFPKISLYNSIKQKVIHPSIMDKTELNKL